MANFSVLISEHRKSTGMSKHKYAAAIGISRSQIERIESGENGRPRPEIMRKISSYTGYSLETLWAAYNRQVRQ